MSHKSGIPMRIGNADGRRGCMLEYAGRGVGMIYK
jgi:hypothetical protein